jgi:hypothetical protein
MNNVRDGNVHTAVLLDSRNKSAAGGSTTVDTGIPTSKTDIMNSKASTATTTDMKTEPVASNLDTSNSTSSSQIISGVDNKYLYLAAAVLAVVLIMKRQKRASAPAPTPTFAYPPPPAR